MKRKMMAAIVITGLIIGFASAQPRGVGLGIILGEPTGFSLKVWNSANFAFDAGLGYSWFRYGQAFHVHGDLLWHTQNLLAPENGFLPLYLGVGGRFKMADEADNYPDVRLGVRIPFGLEYVFVRAPVGLFFEIVPVIDLVPGTYLVGNSAIGFRYYFH